MEMSVCVLREFDFAKQQQVALKLHRAGGPDADSCLWWAITSLVLQAEAAGSAGEAPLPCKHISILPALHTLSCI